MLGNSVLVSLGSHPADGTLVTLLNLMTTDISLLQSIEFNQRSPLDF